MPKSNPNICTILDLTRVAFGVVNVNKDWNQYDQLMEIRSMTASIFYTFCAVMSSAVLLFTLQGAQRGLKPEA